jgi:hypothetical protein
MWMWMDGLMGKGGGRIEMATLDAFVAVVEHATGCDAWCLDCATGSCHTVSSCTDRQWDILAPL